MANFAARKWPEYRILHHLSQGPSADHPPWRRAPCKRGVRRAMRAWWAPKKLCGLPKLIWWGPTWPLKYFLSFKPCTHYTVWFLKRGWRYRGKVRNWRYRGKVRIMSKMGNYLLEDARVKVDRSLDSFGVANCHNSTKNNNTNKDSCFWLHAEYIVWCGPMN